MYKDMITLQTMDTIFYEAQRQGRISFYLTSSGEEAISVASAAALHPDDVVLAQVNETAFTCINQLNYAQVSHVDLLVMLSRKLRYLFF